MGNMKNSQVTVADKTNVLHSGFLLKNYCWPLFASGKLATFRFCLGFSQEEETLVMEVWVSFLVLISYEGINPFFRNITGIKRGRVFTSCLFSSIQHPPLSGTIFQEDSLLLSLTLSALTVLTGRAHVVTTRRQMPL